MKVGVRKPSIKKSISARTTGKAKRKLKKMVNPLYGKKGMGMVKDPKKAVYNKVYNKTTVSAKKSVGCWTICFWYPIYYSCLLMWWIIKYTAIGLWWMCVGIVKGIIALVRWIRNRKINNVPENTIETSAESVDTE